MKKDSIPTILLIVPPVTVSNQNRHFNINFPTGLSYIAAVLEQNNYNVAILDSQVEKYQQEIPLPQSNLIHIGMTFDEIKEEIKKIEPAYVGISALFSFQKENYHKLARVIKNLSEKITVIIGGAHATAAPGELLADNNIDYVVLGEGEITFSNLLNNLIENKNISNISGIAFRDKQNSIIINPIKQYPDVNRLPLPAWHLFNIEKYFETGQRHGIKKSTEFRSLPILTSRGCPFNCSFCSAYQLFGKKYRFRSSESVLEEIDILLDRYHAEDLYLNDDQFLCDKDRAIKILDGIIERNYGITFDAPNGLSPWMLDEDIVRKLKKAGFGYAHIAIESGNQWVLNNIIKKPVRLDQIPQKVELLKKYGLEVSAAIVLGNISKKHIETISQMQDTFDFVRNLNLDNLSISMLTPHIGSEAYNISKEKGFLSDEYIDDCYDQCHLSTTQWTSQEINEFVDVEKLIYYKKNNLIIRKILIPLTRSWSARNIKLYYKLIYILYKIMINFYRIFK